MTRGATVVVGSDAARLSQAVEAERRRGQDEVRVAWTGEGPPPVLPGADVRDTFPALGGAYAVNRLLPLVTSPTVAVRTAGVRARFRTADLVAAGGLDHGLPLGLAALSAAAHLRPGWRRTTALSDRLAARVEARPSARGPLRLLPPALGVDSSQVVSSLPSARAKSHLLYAVPEGRVLHLYADPSPRLRRGTVDRERVREAAPGARVPRLHGAVPGRDCLWVLEEEVHGRPLPREVGLWWDEVSAWAVVLAGPPGRPLAFSPTWTASVPEVLAAVPAGWRPVAAASLHWADRRPARHQHGDLQPKNVLLTEDGPAAVDWEGVWAEGVVGLDLLFLALFARGHSPDSGLLPALVAGGDSYESPVRPALLRLGVAPAEVPDLVRACLAIWTHGEARRAVRLGSPMGPAAPSWFADQWTRIGAVDPARRPGRRSRP